MTRRAWYLVAAIAVLVVVGLVVLGGRGASPAASGAVGSSSPSPTIAANSPVQTAGAASPSPSAAPPSTSTATSHAIATFSLTRDGSPAEPDPVLTPGAADPTVTQANIGSTICVSGYTATVRPPTSYTTPLKRQQIAAYGYTDTSLADYEEDHLIPLELGGAPRDPANLWPEPYTAVAADGTPAGARVKDRLENWLHDQVCSGAMRLVVAQQQIAGNWVAIWEAAGRP